MKPAVATTPTTVYTLATGVVVVHQAAQVGDTVAGAGPDRLLDGVQHQLGAHGRRPAPAEDATRVGVDHELIRRPSPDQVDT